MTEKRKKKPFHGKLVAIAHSAWSSNRSDGVRFILNDFKKMLNPGKTLYMEATQDQIDRIARGVEVKIGGYELLIASALEKGMKVVGLDTKRVISVVDKIDKTLDTPEIPKIARETGLNENDVKIGINDYANRLLREKEWSLVARKAKKGDLVVMHPGHAIRVAQTFRIQREQVVWIHEHAAPAWLTRGLGPEIQGKLREMRNAHRIQRRNAHRKL